MDISAVIQCMSKTIKNENRRYKLCIVASLRLFNDIPEWNGRSIAWNLCFSYKFQSSAIFLLSLSFSRIICPLMSMISIESSNIDIQYSMDVKNYSGCSLYEEWWGLEGRMADYQSIRSIKLPINIRFTIPIDINE